MRTIATIAACLATPFLALAASEHHDWTRFVIAVIFVTVLGFILFRELRTEPKEKPHDHFRS